MRAAGVRARVEDGHRLSSHTSYALTMKDTGSINAASLNQGYSFLQFRILGNCGYLGNGIAF